MKKIVLATVLAALGSASVLAADLPARGMYTKAPMADPATNWSGFYVGGDVGAASMNSSGDDTSNFFENDTITGNNVQHRSLNSNSAIGGVHAGYNWQFAPTWVIGIEGDWQWTDLKHSFCRGTDSFVSPCMDFGRGVFNLNDQIQGIGTVRARLGYTFDRMMIYGTGGIAIGDTKSSIGVDCRVAGCGDSGTRIALSQDTTFHKTGWVAGAGAEWMVNPSWIVRAEYQHIDLGNVASGFNLPTSACFAGGPCGVSWSHDLRYDIVRAGISYKFGSPMLAKY
jgi:outer membrane immunogenic protein